MSQREIPSGTAMFFGAPVQPMPKELADAIGRVVAQVPGVREAYLPQCFVAGDKEARQVLVVGVDKEEKIPEIMRELLDKTTPLLPPGGFIDMHPYSSSDLPDEARVEKCRIFGSRKKPWWKIW